MSPSSALTQSTRDTIYLVRFLYGTQSAEFPLGIAEARYTDAPSAQPGPGGTYSTIEGLELDIPKLTGDLKAKDIKITLPADSFTTYLADGGAHSPVYCFVFEWHKPTSGSAASKLMCVFSGPVFTGTTAPKGKSGLVEIVASPLKSTWDVPLGLFEEQDCIWPLYSGPCSVIKNLYAVSNVKVLSIDNLSFTIQTDAGVTGKEDNWFSRGFAEYEGCILDIRIWRSHDPLIFHTVRQPSQLWIDRYITLYAGCDKLLSTCRARFNKESQHGGAGVGIPPYNPNYQRSGLYT